MKTIEGGLDGHLGIDRVSAQQQSLSLDFQMLMPMKVR